jgi:hypothetical protein
MLVEFTVGNFRSILEPQTLSMVAAKTVAKNKLLDQENVFEANGVRLLKTAALYGANSSGKSNIIKALRFMQRQLRRFTLRRDVDAEDQIDVEPFLLDSTSASRPSHFEVAFIANQTQYRYGFDATRERIVAEWLYYVPEQRETLLFKRDGDTYDLRSVFKKEGDKLQERTRENRLYLPVVSEFNGHIAREVIDWFARLRIDSGLRETFRARATERILDPRSPEAFKRDMVLDLLRSLNLGFDDVSVERKNVEGEVVERSLSPVSVDQQSLFPRSETDRAMNQAPARRLTFEALRTRTVHRSNDSEQRVLFDLAKQESDGTQRVFALAGEIVDVLTRSGVMVVDEMDARLHPILTRNLVQLFNSSQANPRNAQLVFATHDTNLLTNRLFRRDQIWFIEKDQQQASRLYALSEFKGVRNDASFEKDYILGRYGAIPFLGDLRDMLDPPKAIAQNGETAPDE